MRRICCFYSASPVYACTLWMPSICSVIADNTAFLNADIVRGTKKPRGPNRWHVVSLWGNLSDPPHGKADQASVFDFHFPLYAWKQVLCPQFHSDLRLLIFYPGDCSQTHRACLPFGRCIFLWTVCRHQAAAFRRPQQSPVIVSADMQFVYR